MKTERLPRASILRKRSDFARIRTEGKRITGGRLTLNWLQEKGSRQMAVITPKSLGNAVVRNKIKRRIREMYRKLQNKLPENLKSIWIARSSSASASYPQLNDEMITLYQKAKLLLQ